MAILDQRRNPRYVVSFKAGSVVGVNIEIANPAASGKKLIVRRIIFKSDTNTTTEIYRAAVAVSGGTAVAVTQGGNSGACCFNSISSDAPTPVATVRYFTAAPTIDASARRLYRADLTTGIYQDSGEISTQESTGYAVINPGEVLDLYDSSSGATLCCDVWWTEENV